MHGLLNTTGMACPILVGFAASTIQRGCVAYNIGMLCGPLEYVMWPPDGCLYGLNSDGGLTLVYGKKSSLL